MGVEQIFLLFMGAALILEGVRYTAKIKSLLPFTADISADDRLGVATMFGGIQFASGLYVLCSSLIFGANISALLYLAILFGVVGSYRVVGFLIATVARKQLWFGIVELALGLVALLALVNLQSSPGVHGG